ncbi:MAG: TonB-dependent receptor [Bacteroidales bacterium]|nr:TonB-dependent receptor [Bacteroidales bacterium]
MKQKLWMLLLFLYSVTMVAQKAEISGIITDSESGEPISGVQITLKNQSSKAITDSNGKFLLKGLIAGKDELIVRPKANAPLTVKVSIKNEEKKQLGKIEYEFPKSANQEDDNYVFSETQIEEDNNTRQRISLLESESDDVYLKTARFSFSPMRFNYRGYSQDYSTTYINGVGFNDGERGRFNYSMLGGLNTATKSKETVTGLKPNSFGFGGLGSNTNILTRASSYAAGTKASVAYTNRSYKLRAQVTHATGLMANGWAFTTSAVARWADEGLVEGTFYNSAGLFLSAEKILNKQQSISFTAFGAPTQRAQGAAVTQEVYDLAGSIYYNPYWGYQDGKKRNSRIVKSFDPTLVIAHDYKINEKEKIHTGMGVHYSLYSGSALNFYNAPDPRPDYYRNLPSFQTDPTIKDELTQMWTNDPLVRQIDWNSVYQANYRNNEIDPTGSAKYALERRHNNLFETTINSIYTNQKTNELKITAGVEAKYSKGMHYKTMDDLLGGKQWIDIDQFAERDNPINPNIIQNDLKNPNRVIKNGDVFGYNYDMHIIKGNGFYQQEWSFPGYDIYYAGKVSYTQFFRYGNMDNGRALPNASSPNGEISYGKGKSWWFIDPSFKFGFTCKSDGHNRISFNALAESRAPLASNSYISQRIKDTRIPNLRSEKIYSYDLSYKFNYPFINGKITAFQTFTVGSSELFGYYDDEYRTFVNQVLTKSDKVFQGVEAGLSVKINSQFTLSMAGTFADYHYTNDAIGVKSPENGAFADITQTIMTKGMKESTGPQAAGSVKLNYFHPKMWFADLSFNYFDNNYLDFSPNRFSESSIAKYALTNDPAVVAALGTQEKLKGGYMLDASLGKLVYLPHGRSMNLNISFSNLLNNTKMVTGGYQQARLPLDGANIDLTAVDRFPSKYYYAWGFNMFINLGFKF